MLVSKLAKLGMAKKAIDLNFGRVQIIDNILVAELNEGVLFDIEENNVLLELGLQVFKGQPYGYISNRVNSYAVNPLVYKNSSIETNLKAIAIVTHDSIGKKNAMLEKQFYNDSNSFGIFETLEEAINWVDP